jgi:hypothetical protein
MHEALTLSLSPEKLDAWCARMEMPNAAHTLAVTVALQSFISTMIDPAQHATATETAIKAVLDRHAAQARARLLAENTTAIAAALSKRDSQALSRIHQSMSRRGFELAAKQAIEGMNAEILHATADWVLAWCADAKKRGEAASGFPDALNFELAGIDPAEYAAMKDTAIYLSAAI